MCQSDDDEALAVMNTSAIDMKDYQAKQMNKDIADPYDHDDSAFETAKQDIIHSLELWFNKI